MFFVPDFALFMVFLCFFITISKYLATAYKYFVPEKLSKGAEYGRNP